MRKDERLERLRGRSTYSGFRPLRSTLGWSHAEMRGARDRNCLDCCGTFFSPRAAPSYISLRTPEQRYEFAASMIPTGAGIRLLMDPAKLAALGHGEAKEVEVKATIDGTAMGGIVALAGLPKALAWLNFECGQK